MNQILSTSIPNNSGKRNDFNRSEIDKTNYGNTNSSNNYYGGYKARSDVKGPLKFFAISMMVFGVVLIGNGTYAIFKGENQAQTVELQPSIIIENKNLNTILLKVTYQKNIDKIEYYWNNEKSITVSGKGGSYVEKEIVVPVGENTLHVIVYDEDGNQVSYDKSFETESNINFEVAVNKIRILYEGENKISYMTYRWDEEEEERVDIDDTTIEYEIEAKKGLHTLTVVVVDENNNTDTNSKKIEGVAKPKVIIDYDSERKCFVIKASDDEKLSKIKFTLNHDEEHEYELNLDEKNLKELEYKLPMEFEDGENYIYVLVYNSNNISEEAAARYVKR